LSVFQFSKVLPGIVLRDTGTGTCLLEPVPDSADVPGETTVKQRCLTLTYRAAGQGRVI